MPKFDKKFFDVLMDAIAGEIGEIDIPCPICANMANRTAPNRARKVMRVWYDGGTLASFNCARCDAHGYAYQDRDKIKPPRKPQPTPKARPDRARLARDLWAMSGPLAGTLAAVYLKLRKCFLVSPSLRFLPARFGYPPAMVAKFDGCDGIHLTKLRDDGLGKADCEKPKIMLGPSNGWPIIVADRKATGLIVCEGIEDALSWALAAPDLTVWAAGSAGRIHLVLKRAKAFQTVFVSVDNDEAGLTALQKARRIRHDLIAINLTELMQSKVKRDANDVLAENGCVMLRGYLDRCLMQNKEAA